MASKIVSIGKDGANRFLHYHITENGLQRENKTIISYGIRASLFNGNGQICDVRSVDNISVDRNFVHELELELCNSGVLPNELNKLINEHISKIHNDI